VRRFRPGNLGGNSPQVVVEPDESGGTDPLAPFPVEEILRAGGRIVCRLPTVGPVSHSTTENSTERQEQESSINSEPVPPMCDNHGGGSCLAFGFEFLPVDPYRLRWRNGWLHVSIATREYATLRETIERLGGAGFDVDLRQIIRGEHATELHTNTEQRTELVDLSVLTDRQRQVAETAIEMGYFSPDGADAAHVAATLDISQSTLSRHLRVVTEKILSQVLS
jgi:DNA-binding transcriptional ArsR family regulator